MTDRPRVTWAEPGDLAAVAERVARELARPRPLRLCVPGGSTAPKVFAMLAERGLDWSGVTITLNDDRRVPDDHPASNHGKLRAALPDVAIERLVEGADVAPFDLVWLGMGEDGHVASLFPNASPEILNCAAPFLAVGNSPKPPPTRISLSYQTIADARQVWALVSGAGKADALRETLKPDGSTPLARVIRSRPVKIFSEVARF